MRRALKQAGFGSSRRLPSHVREHFVIARASHAIAQGRLPQQASARLPFKLVLAVWVMAGKAWLNPTRREFLYVAAVR